jgi:hypothetical protein
MEINTVYYIILLSWFLNALMDAIDHGKSAETLYELWHILKWCSYALPFISLIYISGMKIWIMIILAFVLMIVWETTYGIARFYHFEKLDNTLNRLLYKWLHG